LTRSYADKNACDSEKIAPLYLSLGQVRLDAIQLTAQGRANPEASAKADRIPFNRLSNQKKNALPHFLQQNTLPVASN
jgi:hypothetical protein